MEIPGFAGTNIIVMVYPTVIVSNDSNYCIAICVSNNKI